MASRASTDDEFSELHVDSCLSRLYRIETSSSNTSLSTLQELMDRLAADSGYPPVKSTISISLKRSAVSAQMLYFFRTSDLHQVAVLPKDSGSNSSSPQVLVGEDALEELITVSLQLIPKTSWTFKSSNILLGDVMFSLGTLDHGLNNASKISMMEVTDLTVHSLTQMEESNRRIDEALVRHLGEEIASACKEIRIGDGGASSHTQGEAAVAQHRARKWIAALSHLS